MAALHQLLACVGLAYATNAFAGIVDPDCTPAKAATEAVTKATVGVGGRCGAAEAAKDTAKRKAAVEDNGLIEKRLDKDGPMDKAKHAAK